MGSVADRITKKIAASRGSNVVDLASWCEGRKMALEAGLGGEGPVSAKFAGPVPCHGMYALAENVVSLMAESISGMREAKGFVRTVGHAEDEYMRSGPPMSPLTVSYFTMWALFDVRFRSSRETMGGCILRIAPEMNFPSWLIGDEERMQRLRMGFYTLRQRGRRRSPARSRHPGNRVLYGSGRLCRRRGPGLVRARASAAASVVPPAYRVQHDLRHPELSRRGLCRLSGAQLARMMAAKKPPRTDAAHGHLMKFGPEPNHWNAYINCAYADHQHEAIFLTCIPDIRQSLHHASAHR